MPKRSEAAKPVQRDLLGVILAGGKSRRFGEDKALFSLAGESMAGWTLKALKPWTSKQVVVTGDLRVAGELGIPGRPDQIHGLGPVGGLHTALSWAEEDGKDGVFLLACDLPLVTQDVVGRILGSWPANAPAAVPESPGPLGFEPLCAGYGVECLPDLEEILATGKRSMEDALSAMGGRRIPMTEVGTSLELALAFTNVNTMDAVRVVERLLKQRHSPSLGPPEHRDASS